MAKRKDSRFDDLEPQKSSAAQFLTYIAANGVTNEKFTIQGGALDEARLNRVTFTDIDLILPPMSRFGGGNREEKKQSVIAKLQTLFERYKGLAQ